MKIIKEIEKSRLSESNMNAINGGIQVGENCSENVIYRSCASLDGKNFEVTDCYNKLSCPASYFACSGPDSYRTCSTTTKFEERH